MTQNLTLFHSKVLRLGSHLFSDALPLLTAKPPNNV